MVFLCNVIFFLVGCVVFESLNVLGSEGDGGWLSCLCCYEAVARDHLVKVWPDAGWLFSFVIGQFEVI